MLDDEDRRWIAEQFEQAKNVFLTKKERQVRAERLIDELESMRVRLTVIYMDLGNLTFLEADKKLGEEINKLRAYYKYHEKKF